jgi:hypothetical protein
MMPLEQNSVPTVPDSVVTWQDDYVCRVVATFPPLTKEQLDRIAVLLRPAPFTPGRSDAA